MRHKFLILALIFTALMFGQNPKVEFQQWKEVTTAERDAFTPLANTNPQIYNITTGQFEYWNGTAWVALVGTPTLQEVVTEGNTLTQSVGEIQFLRDNGDRSAITSNGYRYDDDFDIFLDDTWQIDPIGDIYIRRWFENFATAEQTFFLYGFKGLSLSNTLTTDFYGIKADKDYSPNYDLFTYTQKSYVDGIRESASVSGTTNIDWSNNITVRDYTLTAATTFANLNLPTSTQTKVIELIVRGNFALTLPATWTALPNNDAYLGTGDNHIVVTCINGTTSSEIILYSLTNI